MSDQNSKEKNNPSPQQMTPPPFDVIGTDVSGTDSVRLPQQVTPEAMNIVNQIFDLLEVPVEKRQAFNDDCDLFVQGFLDRAISRANEMRDEKWRRGLDKLIEESEAMEYSLYRISALEAGKNLNPDEYGE